MSLRKGYITYFKYINYHKDPNPMALVLYVDSNLVHCLNIHYLTDKLTDQLIEMIVMVATKRLDARDAYNFYHGHIKRKLPAVIQRAYRTYKPKYIRDVVYLSKGYDETKSLLSSFKEKKKFTKSDIKKIKTKIKKDIVTKDLEPVEIKKLTGISIAQIEQNVDEYLKKIHDILSPKIDMTKFTGIKKRRK